MTTLYDMLDIRPDDGAGAVKEAFRKAVKISHPDLNADDPNAPARFMEIVRANAILCDPELRAVYDRMLEFERQQHQLASATYKIFPDAIVVVVLAVVMAGAYTLYTNFPEASGYLPRIFTTKIKAGADTARAAADATTVRPSPPDETRFVDSPRDEVESAAVPVLGAVAATEANAVAAEDAARASANSAAQSSPLHDLNAAGGPHDHVGGAETSETAVATPTEKNAATENAAHASANSAAQSSPLHDLNAAGGPHDQGASAAPAPPAAVAPVANDSASAKDAVAAPGAVAPPAIDHAVDTASSHEPPPSAPVKDAEFYRRQGIASYRNGDLPMAIADFDLAIRLDPNLEDVYIDRGIVLYRLHQSDRAFADVAQALRIEHSHQNTPPLPRVRPAD
jgi:curved DNA-binding protein CbpA